MNVVGRKWWRRKSLLVLWQRTQLDRTRSCLTQIPHEVTIKAGLSLVAAVLQVADVGILLSFKLYTCGQTVASADKSTVFISRNISHTCSIIKVVSHTLENDHKAQSDFQDVISTADTIVKECLEFFYETDRALWKKISRIGLDGRPDRLAVALLARMKWPFLRPRMMLLWNHIYKLTSSLYLMVNVFIYAIQWDWGSARFVSFGVIALFKSHNILVFTFNLILLQRKPTHTPFHQYIPRRFPHALVPLPRQPSQAPRPPTPASSRPRTSTTPLLWTTSSPSTCGSIKFFVMGFRER